MPNAAENAFKRLIELSTYKYAIEISYLQEGGILVLLGQTWNDPEPIPITFCESDAGEDGGFVVTLVTSQFSITQACHKSAPGPLGMIYMHLLYRLEMQQSIRYSWKIDSTQLFGWGEYSWEY